MTARAISAILLGAVFAGCCQTVTQATPAVLVRTDDATMARLKAVLSKELGRSPIELGPGDLTQSPTLSVLPIPPSPLEDRSLALPTIFRLEMQGGACILLREDTGTRIPLDGVACRPAAQ